MSRLRLFNFRIEPLPRCDSYKFYAHASPSHQRPTKASVPTTRDRMTSTIVQRTKASLVFGKFVSYDEQGSDQLRRPPSSPVGQVVHHRDLPLDQPWSRRFWPFRHRLIIVVDIRFVSDLVLVIFIIQSWDLAVFLDWIIVRIETIIVVVIISCHDSMTSCVDESPWHGCSTQASMTSRTSSSRTSLSRNFVSTWRHAIVARISWHGCSARAIMCVLTTCTMYERNRSRWEVVFENNHELIVSFGHHCSHVSRVWDLPDEVVFNCSVARSTRRRTTKSCSSILFGKCIRHGRSWSFSQWSRLVILSESIHIVANNNKEKVWDLQHFQQVGQITVFLSQGTHSGCELF